MKIPIVLFLVILTCFTVKAIDVQSILQSIPAEERLDFIKSYVQRGYDLITKHNNDKERNSKSMPDEFAIELYNYIQGRELVCFGDGTCIDIGDVGVYPKM